MKQTNQYMAPQSTLLEVRFEGALCTSPPDVDEGGMEGFGGEDQFSGWGK